MSTAAKGRPTETETETSRSPHPNNPCRLLMPNRHDRGVHRIFHASPLASPFNADFTELRTVLLPGKYLYAVRDCCPATLRTAASVRVLPVLGMGVSLQRRGG